MASVSIDSKIKLKLSPELKDIASELFEDENIETVDTIQLKKLREHLRSTPGQFHDLVTKCEMILPKPELAPRNPVLEARIQNLKAKQAQKEYDKMTDNVDPLRRIRIIEREDKPFSEQIQDLNRFIVVIFQFVISIASSFAFGYLAPYYLYGTMSVGPRLLYGIISAFVVGMADLYFVIRHLLETEGIIDLTDKKES